MTKYNTRTNSHRVFLEEVLKLKPTCMDCRSWEFEYELPKERLGEWIYLKCLRCGLEHQLKRRIDSVEFSKKYDDLNLLNG